MVSRIMLSLRKAADLQQEGWTLGKLPGNRTDQRSMVFARPPTEGTNLTIAESLHDVNPEP